jgi:hypothetical protein
MVLGGTTVSLVLLVLMVGLSIEYTYCTGAAEACSTRGASKGRTTSTVLTTLSGLQQPTLGVDSVTKHARSTGSPSFQVFW